GQKDSLTTLFRTHGSLLESIQVVDPYQVRFNFKNPYPFMAAELAVRSGDPFIHSKKYTEAVGAESAAKKPVGTGPFKFVEHKLGDSVRLEALPSHWRQTAGFQYLIYKLVPAAATAVQMLKAGDIDVAAIDTGNIDELKASGFTFLRGADSYGYYVGLGGQIQQSKYPQIFDPKIPWVGDPSNPASIQNAFKVRQALALAVDKESIVRNIFKGAASANAVSTYEAGRPWTDSKWKPVPYDVTKAKQLLTEAGYPNGLEFPLYTYPMAGRPDIPTMAEAVAMMWQQIGVKTSIRLTDSGSFKPNFQKDRKLGFAAFTETVSRKDTEPTIHFSTYFNSGGTYYNGIEDARLDDLQKRIMSETDPAKRYELEKQRGQLFIENNWVIFIADKGTVFAVGPKVAQLTPDWSGNGSRPAYQYALPK
ncbi:MAG: hypothetical protein HYX90_03475, partial [Chloroflexi bacterium]|nr:hypothetical protein [Chloroflexota bacterium]